MAEEFSFVNPYKMPDEETTTIEQNSERRSKATQPTQKEQDVVQEEEEFEFINPYRMEPTEEEQIVAQTPEKTVFDEIQDATPSMTGALIGGAVGAPLGPVGVVVGATLGGAIGEYGKMAYEYLTGDSDLPDSALEQAKRATIAGLEGGGGEGAGALISKGAGVGLNVLNKARNNNLANKALEAAKKKVIEQAPAGLKGPLQYREQLGIKSAKNLYEETANNIAEGAVSELSPSQRGELFLSAVQGGKSHINAASKSLFMEMDKSIKAASRQGFLSQDGGIISTSPIKQEIANRLEPFTQLSSPKSKDIVGRVTSYVDNIGPKVDFEQAYTLRTELQNAINMAEDVGNTRLATALRRSQNKVSDIMETSAEAAGKGREFKVSNKLWVEGSEHADNTFLRTLLEQDPRSAGTYLFSEGTPQQINKVKSLVQATKGLSGPKKAQLFRDMQEGYFKEVFNRTIDPETGAFDIQGLTNILSDPKQVKNLKAAFGDKYGAVENLVKNIKKHQKSPAEYLTDMGSIVGMITGMIDPITGIATIGGVRLGGRAATAGANISAEVLSRLASNPDYLKTLNITLRTPSNHPQAARLLGQLKTTIADIIQDIQEEGKVEEPFEFINPYAMPGEESTTAIPSNKDETTKQVEASTKSPEQWIQKYRQLNPGTTREFAIKEGKRTGQLPKDYESPPLGIRNNNPGNIRVSNINWKGKVGGHTGPFEKFKTVEDGIRALAVNLRTYQNRYGLNTVSEIISRWAPPSENATGSYINTVSKELGVKPNEVLDLNDPKILKKLASAIIRVENGKMPYDDRTLSKGINMAMDRKSA